MGPGRVNLAWRRLEIARGAAQIYGMTRLVPLALCLIVAALPAAAQTYPPQGAPPQAWQPPRQPPPPDLQRNLDRLRQSRQAQDRQLMQDARHSELVRRMR